MDICPKCYSDQRFVGSFQKKDGKFVCNECGHEMDWDQGFRPDATEMIKTYFSDVFTDWPYNDLDYENLMNGVLKALEGRIDEIQRVLDESLKDCKVLYYS